MDILIKNMEMPSCCGNCEFNQFHEGNPWTTWYTCMFLNKDTDNVGNNRLADCPLVALPSHGDLIDRGLVQEVLAQLLPLVITNELTDKEIGLVHRTVGAIAEMINEQEVVVEATE